jgi:hypothetical protein
MSLHTGKEPTTSFADIMQIRIDSLSYISHGEADPKSLLGFRLLNVMER